MILYLVSRNDTYKATAEYNIVTRQFTVKAGSVVSADIAHSPSFRGAKSIEKHRAECVVDRIVQKDITFTSPSTAANFVTGRSSNGMLLWKDESGKTIKIIVESLAN